MNAADLDRWTRRYRAAAADKLADAARLTAANERAVAGWKRSS